MTRLLGRSAQDIGIEPYRIGWGLLARLAGRYRKLVPLIIRGRQSDGQKVRRTRWLSMIRRDLKSIFAGHPKRLLHQPWQAEAEGLRFARRGLTPRQARRRMEHDVAYELVTGQRAPYQRWRRWLARRWDRKHLGGAGR
jgi:hypothetical protein